jgi:hypothetical protein
MMPAKAEALPPYRQTGATLLTSEIIACCTDATFLPNDIPS